MAVYDVSMPDLPSEDRLQALRDAQDARIRARMRQGAYLADLRQRFADALEATDTPLEELATMLFQAPIRDEYDHRAFCHSQMRDARRLGEAVLRLVTDASLAAYREAAADEPF